MTYKQILDKQHERGQTVAQMREIHAKDGVSGYTLTDVERESYKKLNEKQQALQTEIAALERDISEFKIADIRGEELAKLEADLKAGNATRSQITTTVIAAPGTNPSMALSETQKREVEQRESAERDLKIRQAARKYFLDGAFALSQEQRALVAGSETGGGYLVPSVQMSGEFLKNVDDATWIRGKATKFQVPKAEALGVIKLVSDPSDPIWTSELLTGDTDDSVEFGMRELHPHPLAKKLLFSEKLLRSSIMDIESFVISRLAYKFSIVQEANFMTGNGVQRPLGLFTPSIDGISTARDKVCGSATNFTGDGLRDCLYELKSQYMAIAEWLFHRKAVLSLSKLKDGNGQYLWQPGLQQGQPDRLLGRPLNISEFVPNTFTANEYVGMIGDFSYYWIADALSMRFQRLNELFALTNQIGIIGRVETDGAPAMEEPFVRMKLGA